MLLMIVSAMRSTATVAINIATIMEIIAIVEMIFCREIMLACSDWSLAASASPADAAWFRAGVQVLTIILAACC